MDAYEITPDSASNKAVAIVKRHTCTDAAFGFRYRPEGASMRFSGLCKAVLATGLVLAAGSERASAATFCGGGSSLRVATVQEVATTSSTTLTDLPGASVTAMMGGCARVQFSAQVKAKSPGGLRIQLLRNGSPAGVPATMDFRTSGDGYDTRTATFIVRNIPSGSQTLQIQFASTDGKVARVSKIVVTVWYGSGV